MNRDILAKEKHRIDRLARKHFSDGRLRYVSAVDRDGTYIMCSVGVLHPDRRAVLTREIYCSACATAEGAAITYDLYESGRFIGKCPKKSVIRIIRSRLDRYLETGYRELVQKALNAERSSILKAIEELP